MLDAAENEEYINSTYFLSRESMPRLVVLRRTGSNRAFAISESGEVDRGVKSMRAFLERVHDGGVRWEYEGLWGAPDRWWRTAKRHVPPLAALDWLPSYTFSAIAATCLTALVLYLVFWLPLTLGEEPDEAPRPAVRAAPRRTMKID